MKNFCFTLILTIILASSCSKSNSELNENPSSYKSKDITTITLANNQIYQIDILNSGSNIITTNLTESLGVENGYKTLATGSDFITFFKMPFGVPNNYYVYQKNIINSTTKVGSFNCTLDNDEMLNMPTRSEKKLIEFTGKWNGDFPFNFVRTYDLATGDCTLITLHAGQLYGSQNIFVDGEILYATYRNEQNKYEIDKINLNTGQLENQLEFDSNFFVTVGNNKLHVFLYDNNIHETYNTSDFQLFKSGSFNLLHQPGFFKSSFNENEMYIDLPYTQPNIFLMRPVTIDLANGNKIKDSDFGSLSQKLSEKLNVSPITFTKYVVDVKNNLIISGFHSPDPKINGIVYTNFNADILKIVELDYTPGEIIIR